MPKDVTLSSAVAAAVVLARTNEANWHVLLQAFGESVLVAVIAATDEHLSADGQHCEQHGQAQ